MKFRSVIKAGTAGRNGPSLTYLAVALVLATLAALAAARAVQDHAPSAPALVAARDLAPGTRLTTADLRVEHRPRAGLPRDAYSDATEALGQVVRGPLLAGDLVRPGHLTTARGGPLATSLSNTGLRALALPAEVTAGLVESLRQGDRLDIYAVVPVQTREAHTTVARLVARAAPVLQVSATGSGGLNQGLEPGSGGVVVGLTPRQVAEASLALTAGRLYVAVSPEPTGEGSRVPTLSTGVFAPEGGADHGPRDSSGG